MSKNNVELDTTAFNRLLDQINEEERRKMIMKALKKGGDEVRQLAVNLMVQKVGEGATRQPKEGSGWKKPMTEGVRVIQDKDFLSVIVSILKDVRGVWFEGGTKLRKLLRTGAKDRERGYTKGDKRYLHRKKGKENFYQSGSNRGKIKPTNFFSEATENPNILPTIEQQMKQELEKALQRLTK